MKKVGIDIGGTKVSFIIEDERKNKKIYSQKWIDNINYYKDIKFINITLNKLLKNDTVQSLTISFPGLIKNGIVYKWPNRKNWEGKKLENSLKKNFPRAKINIIEDSNSAALTNKKLFKNEDSLFLNLGTGIGLGIVINGNLYKGVNGVAGELGHTQIDTYKHINCGCTNTKCLQSYYQIFKDDNNFIDILSNKIYNLMLILDITNIQIAGGFIKNHLFIFKEVKKKILKLESNYLNRSMKIVLSKHENPALIGTILYEES